MKAPLDNSVVLITGASSGIGYEFAKQLGQRAKALILVARRKDRLEVLSNELLRDNPALKVTVLPCDLTDLKAVDQMLSQARLEHGCIDILINNAGFGHIGMFESAPWERLHSMIETNVIALTYLTRQLVGPMIERRRGGILMVGSTVGIQAIPAFATYCGTKHYVYGFTEALRAEVRDFRVVVSQLCPGPVATEFGEVASPGLTDDVPERLLITAEKCARIAIRGFSAGQAVIIPGAMIRGLMGLQRATPRPALRLLMSGVARVGRARLKRAP